MEPAGRSSPNRAIKVFLVDDHELVLEGIKAMLGAVDGIEVVGTAQTAETALGRIPLAEPDVALLDINLPEMSGIELCRELRERCPRVVSVMLTSYAEDEALFDAVLAGATGFVLKHVRGSRLVECIRQAARGESLTDPIAAEHVRARVREADGADPMVAHLTGQEREVLRHLAEGLTNREIGEEMYLSDKTVKNYVSNVLSKLGMKRRSEAAALEARIEERRRLVDEPASRVPPVRY